VTTGLRDPHVEFWYRSLLAINMGADLAINPNTCRSTHTSVRQCSGEHNTLSGRVDAATEADTGVCVEVCVVNNDAS
jgi:hypothetical protein